MATCSVVTSVKYTRKGEDGRGVVQQLQYWAISNSSVTAPTYPSSAASAPSSTIWSTSTVTPTKAKPYVWTYTRIQWTSGTTWTMTTPAVIAIRGNDGAKLRGIYDFSGVDSSYILYSGNDGEEWYDVIKYSSQYWKVNVTGAKSKLGTPSSSNSNYVLYTKFQFMATNSLVADSIVMEKDGEILFRAEDGTVECKTGVFENVDVSGAITANTLDLAIDKSFYLVSSGATIILPALTSGFAREITVVTRQDYLNANTTLTFKGETPNVRIGTPTYDSSSVTNQITTGTGVFKCIGYYYNSYTYWFVARLTIASTISTS